MSSNGMELRPARQLAVFRRLAGCAVDATKNALRFAPLATGLLFCEEESCGIGSDLTSVKFGEEGTALATAAWAGRAFGEP